jgi:hypothetical protein
MKVSANSVATKAHARNAVLMYIAIRSRWNARGINHQ